MAQYLIVIEKAERNYASYSPDLPGCVATGKTRAETIRNMQDAIELHIQGLREDNEPIPSPSASADYVTIST